ncbi:MAG: HEPN domain-containing protein [Prevotella sp.]|nr:HEPN domain-containing protein [Prevotella sp.]
MNEGLTPEQRADLVAYRLERAHQTMDEARYLYDGGYFNASVNRLYYACFYASMALLISRGLNAATHNGVKTILSKEFIRTGMLDMEHGVTFGDLFNKRHTGDYDDYAFCDASTVDYLSPRAQAFIDAVEAIIG